MHRTGMLSLLLSLALTAGPLGCGPAPEAQAPRLPLDTTRTALSTSGLTPDFRNWLSAHGYNSYDFPRDDLTGGSYGGRASAGDSVVNTPVIFVHGNSDVAVGTSYPYTGFSQSIQYFLNNGYKTSELYTTTWGLGDPNYASQQYHSKAYVMKIRKFIEAVKAYTGASQVSVISHSMGVTLARQAVLGGNAYDEVTGSYSIGPPLTSSVNTFVGIAGGNLGLTACYTSGGTTPTCDNTDGFYPGYWNGFGVSGLSSFLGNLLNSSRYEGGFRYAIFSTADEVIGGGDLVYGQYTSRIPGETGEVVFTSAPYGHFGLRDLTGYNQLRMVRNHATN